MCTLCIYTHHSLKKVSQFVAPKQLSIHDEILHKEADYAVKRLLASSNGPPTAVFNALHQSTLNVTLMLGFNYRIEDPEDPFLAKIFDLITISIDSNEHLYDRRAFFPITMTLVDWWKQTYKKLVRVGKEIRPMVLQELARHGSDSDRECLFQVVDAIRDGKDIDDEAVRSLCCKYYRKKLSFIHRYHQVLIHMHDFIT